MDQSNLIQYISKENGKSIMIMLNYKVILVVLVLLYSAKSVNLVAGGKGQGIVHEDNSLLSSYSRGVDTENGSQIRN